MPLIHLTLPAGVLTAGARRELSRAAGHRRKARRPRPFHGGTEAAPR